MFRYVQDRKFLLISDLRNGRMDGKMQHLVRAAICLLVYSNLSFTFNLLFVYVHIVCVCILFTLSTLLSFCFHSLPHLLYISFPFFFLESPPLSLSLLPLPLPPLFRLVLQVVCLH